MTHSPARVSLVLKSSLCVWQLRLTVGCKVDFFWVTGPPNQIVGGKMAHFEHPLSIYIFDSEELPLWTVLYISIYNFLYIVFLYSYASTGITGIAMLLLAKYWWMTGWKFEFLYSMFVQCLTMPDPVYHIWSILRCAGVHWLRSIGKHLADLICQILCFFVVSSS